MLRRRKLTLSLRFLSLAVAGTTTALASYALTPAPDLATFVAPCADPARPAASRAAACRDLSSRRLLTRMQHYQIAQWQALAHLDLGDWDAALDAAGRAIAFEPDRAGGYRMIARINLRREDHAAAANALREVVAREPESYPDWGVLLFALSRARQFREYEDVLQSMPDWDEANPQKLLMRGLSRQLSGDYAGAASDAREVLAREPGNATALKLRDWVCGVSAAECVALPAYPPAAGGN
ncbi:tetratricopeptide repeat protein [Defluviimonas sp. SAOS-178_SWC]|uniref:tetratricopeptide repeat protein n=1 Tax=Defluviimonas sp. SAOS-178_SWC TaxID=3121287 RepID=UPI0032218467